MIRVTRLESPQNQIVIKVDGALCSQTIGELTRMVASEGEGAPLVFDLSGLASLDSDGRALLIQLRERGHVLCRGSLYIKSVLEEAQQ